MGQKVNPVGLRLQLNKDWDSRWFAKKNDYVEGLRRDLEVKKYFKGKDYAGAAIARVCIAGASKRIQVNIHTARPGVLIGQKGAGIDKVKKDLEALLGKGTEVHVNIVEVKRPDIEARLVAQGIAQQIEKRVSFRRAMKRAMQSAFKAGAKGMRVNCSGRLGGAEIARMEWYREGQVPLHTLRSDIDYGVATAHTTYGACGIKTWIYKGEVRSRDRGFQVKSNKI